MDRIAEGGEEVQGFRRESAKENTQKDMHTKTPGYEADRNAKEAIEAMGQPAKTTVREFVEAAHGDLPKVRRMLESDLQLLNMPHGSETALGAACQMRRKDIVEYLLSQGAEMDIYAACVLGRTEAVRSFLDANAALVNAKARHAHRKPPLYFAAGQPEVEALLKSRGAE